MNDMTCIDVGVEDVLRGRAAPGVGAGGGIVPFADHVADLGDAGVAAQRKASRRTIFMPLYCFGLCEAVTDAPVVAVSGDGEVHHVGRNHPVVDDVGALLRRAPR